MEIVELPHRARSRIVLGALTLHWLAAGFVVLLAGSFTAAQVLLRDSFKLSAPNPDSDDVNFQITRRQQGLLAPITYSKGGEPIFSQVGNAGAPDALLLACRAGGTSGSVSLDHSFDELPGRFDMMVVQFDVNPVQIAPGFNTTEDSWVCIDFSSTAAGRNQFPQFTDGIGLLFRGNGQTQAFDNGTDLADGAFAPAADHQYHHIRIEIVDPGDGTPFDFDGSPAMIRAFADDSTRPFLSYTRAHGFASNYLSFLGEGDGSGGDGVVRHELPNLQISTERQLAGDTNDDGKVDFTDLLTLAAHYGSGPLSTPNGGDFTNDGNVGSTTCCCWHRIMDAP